MTENINYNKLIDRMYDYRLNQSTLAEAIGIHRVSMNNKLNSKTAFTQSEIIKICNLLEIPHKKVGDYFFIKSLVEVEKKEG